MTPNAILFFFTLLTSPWCMLFFYESEWGVCITTFSLFASQMAARHPKSDWQALAVVTSEIAMGLNIVITPVFWIVFRKMTFEHLSWHGQGLFLRIIFAVHHIFPIVTSVLNLYLSDQYFLKKDWKILSLAGFIYIFANALGTHETHHPIYPIFDWKDPTMTFLGYFIQVPLLALIQHLMASYTQHVYRKKA